MPVFAGRRILEHQTMLSLLYQDTPVQVRDLQTNSGDEREPFDHPALRGLENLKSSSMLHAVKKQRLARLAGQLGLTDVVRWIPRMVSPITAGSI